VILFAALLAGQSVTGAAGQSAEGSEVTALLLEVARNESAMTGRRLEYTWTLKVTEREPGKGGDVKKQSVNVYEVYPVRGQFARKLLSRDGIPVSQERADRELKQTAERLEKAAREEQKRAEGKAPPPPTPPTPAAAQNPNGIPSFGFSNGQRRGNGFSSHEISFAVWRFFRYGEFANPRRERLRGRDCIVLDFHPRADFRPADEVQKPYARLAGRLWVDAADKAVARLEAWPHDPQRPGAAPPPAPVVVFEHERVAEGVWLEHFFHLNTYAHKDLFNGIGLDTAKEYSDFKRFTSKAGDDDLDPPEGANPPQL
jgi:hypothetical protein